MHRIRPPHLARLAGTGLLAALAAGCASTHGLAPVSAPRDPDTLEATASLGGLQPGTALSEAAWPENDWWTAWRDPQLDALMADALRDAPSLDAADARLRLAQAQAGLADEARRPAASGSARYSGTYLPEGLVPSGFGGGNYTGVSLISVSLAYAPDLWGGKRAQWEAAVDRAHAAELDAHQARLLLTGNIARTYVALAQAHALQTASAQELERAQASATLGRRRLQAGLDNGLDLRRAETAVAAARQQSGAAQQRIQALHNALAALAGQGPDYTQALAAPVIFTPDAAAVPAVLPSRLLARRPDIVAARWRVEATARDIDAAQAAFRPDVNLSAMAGLVSGDLGALFESGSVFGTAGPAIGLPIFQGRRLRTQLAARDADYDLAVARYDQTLLDALRETVDAVQAARALDAQILAAHQAREAAVRARDLLATRQRAGLGTRLDVLAAQQPVVQLDLQIASLQAQRLTVATDLAVALGGGVMPPTAPIPSVSSAP